MEKVTHVSPTTPTPDPMPTTPAHESLLKPMAPSKKPQMNQKLMLGIIAVVVVMLGVGTGRILASTTSGGSGTPATAPDTKQSDSEAGISNVNDDEYDSAQGILKEGGIDGEGTHHVEREGGPTKTVYVASSVLNLQDFVDKKIEVWGQTISGKKAGWLMDVVKIKEID